MAQPDNFGFGEEAALLKASARKFFADNFPTDPACMHWWPGPQSRAQAASACGITNCGSRWLTWAGPAGGARACGGVGMPVVAVAGLAEELGRAAFPCPLLATINVTYVLAACAGGAAALAEIAEGISASLAITNRQRFLVAGRYRCQLCRRQAQWHGLVCAGRAQG